MKRHVRPSSSPIPPYWYECDILNDEEDDALKSCWCQYGTASYSPTSCNCPCHIDANTRGVYR